MRHAYIVQGPCIIGNQFGYYGVKIPDGRWVIVENDEYANGGYGPCSVDGKLYQSEEAAKEAYRKLIREAGLEDLFSDE